jgi:N-acetylglucosaminyldiphosphoundecaprenol N-acetyl-beta-D-mannosaminyltransferase
MDLDGRIGSGNADTFSRLFAPMRVWLCDGRDVGMPPLAAALALRPHRDHMPLNLTSDAFFSSGSAPDAPAPVPAPAVALAPPRAGVVGIPLGLTDYERTMDWMDAMIAAGQRGYLTAAAVHLVMVAREDPRTRAAVLGATLAVPDGQPLVWALRALGHADVSRVYGPELMARYCERAARRLTPVYLYGGRDQGALVQLTLNLRQRYPGLRIVGGYSPPFRPLTDEEEEWVVHDINRSGAQVVWVGTGQPKQEHWMADMRDRLEAPVLVGVGAAFDFHAGLVPQAPPWIQTLGLEWSYRLAREPRRLWRRYARYNPRFVAAFARQYLRSRRA